MPQREASVQYLTPSRSLSSASSRTRVLTRDAKMHHCRGVNNYLLEHLLRLSGASSIRALALDIGMEPSTLNRQLAGEVKVQTIVAICRRYDAPLLPAFVAAGFITEAEAIAMGSTAALSTATDKELAQEILDRVTRNDGLSDALSEPLHPKHPNVTDLSTKRSAPTPSVSDALGRAAAREVDEIDTTEDRD